MVMFVCWQVLLFTHLDWRIRVLLTHKHVRTKSFIQTCLCMLSMRNGPFAIVAFYCNTKKVWFRAGNEGNTWGTETRTEFQGETEFHLTMLMIFIIYPWDCICSLWKLCTYIKWHLYSLYLWSKNRKYVPN